MNKGKAWQVAILEPSTIIFEGLQQMMQQMSLNCSVWRIESLDELTEKIDFHHIRLLFINPMQFVNREKDVKRIRKEYPNMFIIGIDFGLIQKQPMLVDSSITLYDSVEDIEHTITRLIEKDDETLAAEKRDNDTLTEREIDVLKGLINGLSNKEIADDLNISVHTVISHRKNITIKTGIRSQSGLTIYAITKKIIVIDDIEL